jgi:hypothetical protein
MDASKEYSVASEMNEKVTTLVAMSDVVHSLQKERGMSSLYLSGSADISPLQLTRTQTDDVLLKFNERLKGYDFSDANKSRLFY